MSVYNHVLRSAPPINFSNPIGKLDIEEMTNEKRINFVFHFSLPVVEMLLNGIDEISFAITPSSESWTYQYFTGNVDSMDGDIQQFFNNQYSLNTFKASEYSSYWYNRYSLTSFISDKKISKIGKLKTAMVDAAKLGGVPKGMSPDEIAAQIKNEGSFLALAPRDEPLIDISKFPANSTTNSFKEYFKILAGVYSHNPFEIGNVEFIKNLTNDSFKGNLSFTSEDKIALGDKKYPKSFWSLWQKLFKWDITESASALTLSTFKDSMYPCKVSGHMSFPVASDRVLLGLFLKDSLKIEIDFHKNGESAGYKKIHRSISFLDLVKQSSAGLKPPEVRVSPMGTYDKIHLYNPNLTSLCVTVSPVIWKNHNKKQFYLDKTSLKIEPRSETEISLSDPAIHASRYYQINSYSGFWKYFLQMDIDHTAAPLNSLAVKTTTATVPGVFNVVNPTLEDPKIGCYFSTNEYIKVIVGSIPPFIDQIKYYYKRTSSSGVGSQRFCGSKRSDYIYISSDPSSSDGFPAGELSINHSTLSPGNYDIVADLYQKGCIVDTISTMFYKKPQVAAATHGVEFNPTFLDATGNVSVKINQTFSGEGSDIAEDAINFLINDGEAVPPLNEPFSQTWASSKTMSNYLLTRFNYDNCTTELLGTITGDTSLAMTVAESESSNPRYAIIIEQYVSTVGQLISTNSPHTTTEGGLDINVDYAKFKSQKYLKTQTLPSVTYSLSGPDAWPSKALEDANTGKVFSRFFSSDSFPECTVLKMTVEFDEIRRVNILRWQIEWTDTEYPDTLARYWLILATYGGLTSPIAYAYSNNPEDSDFCIVDKTLAGAMGLVTYKVMCVFPNGSISGILKSAAIKHFTDKNLILTTGKGL